MFGGDVRVGLRRVDVGRRVGAEVEKAGAVSRGSRVRRVAVTGKVVVGVGVRVLDGVAVGIVDVMVGVSVGVCVGAVDVGNGPRSASDVSARAVLVLFAVRNTSIPWVASPNVNQSHRKAPIIRAHIPAARRLSRLLVRFNSVDFLFEANYGYVVGGTCVAVAGGGCGVRVGVGRGVFVNVARGTLVRAVNVMNTIGDGV